MSCRRSSAASTNWLNRRITIGLCPVKFGAAPSLIRAVALALFLVPSLVRLLVLLLREGDEFDFADRDAQ